MNDPEPKPVHKEEKDIDLGIVFNSVSKAFIRLGRAFRLLSNELVSSFLDLIIFLKKKLVWLLLSFVIGFSYGIYLNYSRGANYSSSMKASFNFGSNYALYNSLDYLNSLISEGRYKDLSELLSIQEKEAKRLVSFSADAIDDELVLSELYKQFFFDYNKNSQFRTDTFWTKTIPYKQFKNDVTKYDIPMQEITVVSTVSDIFPKLEAGLINLISRNGTLKKNHELNSQIQNDDERIIITSLQGLDTLRTVYNDRLRTTSINNGTSSSNINVLDKSQLKPNPELELYEKVLQLKDELKTIRNHKLKHQELIQVYASFSPVGKKASVFKQDSFKYAYLATLIVLLLFVLFEAYKALSRYEKRQRA
jgi:hypothetical protein